MGKDYYAILGCARDASADDIKRAYAAHDLAALVRLRSAISLRPGRYKKMAFKWHPDKNLENKDVAEKKFKEVSEAYDVLSDENKREVFNQYGEEGLKGGAGGGGRGYEFAMDPNDIFAQMFGQMAGGGGGGFVFHDGPGIRHGPLATLPFEASISVFLDRMPHRHRTSVTAIWGFAGCARSREDPASPSRWAALRWAA